MDFDRKMYSDNLATKIKGMLESRYRALSCSLIPSKLRSSEDKDAIELKELPDRLSSSSVFIKGEPFSGKSCTLLRLSLELVSRFESNNFYRVPVYINLGDATHLHDIYKSDEFYKTYLSNIGFSYKYDQTQKLLEHFKSSRGDVLYLIDLDELSNIDEQEIVGTILPLLLYNGRIFIASSRNEHLISRISKYETETYSVERFGLDDSKKYIAASGDNVLGKIENTALYKKEIDKNLLVIIEKDRNPSFQTYLFAKYAYLRFCKLGEKALITALLLRGDCPYDFKQSSYHFHELLKEEKVFPSLKYFLDTNDIFLIRNAIETLGKNCNPNSYASVKEMLDERDYLVKCAAINTLTEYFQDQKEEIFDLLKVIFESSYKNKDKDEINYQKERVKSIRKIYGSRHSGEVNHYGVRAACLENMVILNKGEAWRYLKEAINDDSRKIRSSAIGLLNNYINAKDEEIIAFLERRLHDDDGLIRYEATKIINNHYKNLPFSFFNDHLRMELKSIGRSPDEGVLKTLFELLCNLDLTKAMEEYKNTQFPPNASLLIDVIALKKYSSIDRHFPLEVLKKSCGDVRKEAMSQIVQNCLPDKPTVFEDVIFDPNDEEERCFLKEYDYWRSDREYAIDILASNYSDSLIKHFPKLFSSNRLDVVAGAIRTLKWHLPLFNDLNDSTLLSLLSDHCLQNELIKEGLYFEYYGYKEFVALLKHLYHSLLKRQICENDEIVQDEIDVFFEMIISNKLLDEFWDYSKHDSKSLFYKIDYCAFLIELSLGRYVKDGLSPSVVIKNFEPIKVFYNEKSEIFELLEEQKLRITVLENDLAKDRKSMVFLSSENKLLLQEEKREKRLEPLTTKVLRHFVLFHRMNWIDFVFLHFDDSDSIELIDFKSQFIKTLSKLKKFIGELFQGKMEMNEVIPEVNKGRRGIPRELKENVLLIHCKEKQTLNLLKAAIKGLEAKDYEVFEKNIKEAIRLTPDFIALYHLLYSYLRKESVSSIFEKETPIAIRWLRKFIETSERTLNYIDKNRGYLKIGVHDEKWINELEERRNDAKILKLKYENVAKGIEVSGEKDTVTEIKYRIGEITEKYSRGVTNISVEKLKCLAGIDDIYKNAFMEIIRDRGFNEEDSHNYEIIENELDSIILTMVLEEHNNCTQDKMVEKSYLNKNNFFVEVYEEDDLIRLCNKFKYYLDKYLKHPPIVS